MRTVRVFGDFGSEDHTGRLKGSQTDTVDREYIYDRRESAVTSFVIPTLKPSTLQIHGDERDEKQSVCPDLVELYP